MYLLFPKYTFTFLPPWLRFLCSCLCMLYLLLLCLINPSEHISHSTPSRSPKHRWSLLLEYHAKFLTIYFVLSIEAILGLYNSFGIYLLSYIARKLSCAQKTFYASLINCRKRRYLFLSYIFFIPLQKVTWQMGANIHKRGYRKVYSGLITS